MVDPESECQKCFGAKEIFNGRKMIPCPICTDPAFASEDTQEKVYKLLFNDIQLDESEPNSELDQDTD